MWYNFPFAINQCDSERFNLAICYLLAKNGQLLGFVVCSKHQLVAFPQHRLLSSHSDCLTENYFGPLYTFPSHAGMGNVTDAFSGECSDLGQK